MSKSSLSMLLRYPARMWARLYRFLAERNEKAVAEWSASLQYKRRYTDPEDAKRFRRLQ
jgi:hypothetical protein